MKVINGLSEITAPFHKAVVAIGNFDGVHRGHQAIFETVRQKAAAIGGTAVAITFDPHPVKVLNKKQSPPLITRLDQKIELIGALGIDVTICIPFDESFAALTAREFTEDILVGKIGMKAIVIGRDYTFGKNRKGDVNYLNEAGDRLGFEVMVADWIPMGKDLPERVSSTRVREVIEAGDVAYAHTLLGRYYQLKGRVRSGRSRGGRLLGFPTANINLQDELCPKMGVYAVTVQLGSGRYKGVANIGYSPTFDDYVFTVEVHLLDFSGDLYDQEIRVNFICRIRDEKKFNNVDELSAQITRDIETAKAILSETEAVAQ